MGANAVELHTGAYARAYGANASEAEKCSGTNLSFRTAMEYELSRIKKAAAHGEKIGILVNAGHGIDYNNIQSLMKTWQFNELNIGFAIVAKSLEIGMEKAVSTMKSLIKSHVCVES